MTRPWVVHMRADVDTHSASAVTYSIQAIGYGPGRAIASNGFAAGDAFFWQSGVTQNLGTLGGGTTMTYGVNSKGEVIGWSKTANGSVHAFLWHSGVMEDLGTLEGQETMAYGINDNSQIVGYSVVSGGMAMHPFLYQNGSMQDLGTILGHSASAHGINSTGDIVGWFYSGGSKAFLLHDGAATDLHGLPSGNGDYLAYDINDNGEIVGTAMNQFGRTRPVLWENGIIQDLGMQDIFGYANAINNKGQIVGYTYTDATQPHAFLWANGGTQYLPVLPGTTASYAYDINDNGWIVGTCDGQAVLWTSVAEPASLSVLFTGLLCVLPRLQRRRR